MVYCNISHVITCDTLRWIWCLWYHSECISTPRASLKNMPGHAWNRTYDLWNISPMLCQLSYAVKRGQVISSMSYFGNESSSFWYQYNLAIMIFSVLVLCTQLSTVEYDVRDVTLMLVRLRSSVSRADWASIPKGVGSIPTVAVPFLTIYLRGGGAIAPPGKEFAPPPVKPFLPPKCEAELLMIAGRIADDLLDNEIMHALP